MAAADPQDDDVDDDGNGNKNKGFLEFLLNPYESKIPKELEAEIYRAEGNTPAARDRNQRVALYGLAAVILVGCAFFNGFLTELRNGPVMQENPSMTLESMGFGWVTGSAILSFLFLNKIGGGLALISGAVSGMMAEAELDSRRKNAELIWEEMERRKNAKAAGGSISSKKKKKAQQMPSRKKQRQSGKQAKRLEALSEVVAETNASPPVQVESLAEPMTAEQTEPEQKPGKEGIMGTLEGWYKKADAMAASQALLLNKELEDRGVLEKITDETGLKVVGKGAASQLKKDDESNSASEKPATEDAGPVGAQAAILAASSPFHKKVVLIDAPRASGMLMNEVTNEDLSIGGPTGLFSKALRDTSKQIKVSTLRGSTYDACI